MITIVQQYFNQVIGHGIPLSGGASHRNERHNIDACGKGIFSQSQLSVQTLSRCPYSPRVQSHASTSAGTFKSNTGSHSIVYTHENAARDPNFPKGIDDLRFYVHVLSCPVSHEFLHTDGSGFETYSHRARILGDSCGVVNSLDFCPTSLKSLGCFYCRCVLSSQWKAVTVNLRISHCQL